MHLPRHSIWGDIWKLTQKKIIQKQAMWLCICSGEPFEDSFENSLRRQVLQVQQLWLCLCSCRQFEETFENSLRKKSYKCNQCTHASLRSVDLRRHLKTHYVQAFNLRTHLKIHSGDKSYKCNQCEYASIQASNLKRHLKTHSGDTWHKCNQCEYASAEVSVMRGNLKTHSGHRNVQPVCFTHSIFEFMQDFSTLKCFHNITDSLTPV